MNEAVGWQEPKTNKMKATQPPYQGLKESLILTIVSGKEQKNEKKEINF